MREQIYIKSVKLTSLGLAVLLAMPAMAQTGELPRPGVRAEARAETRIDAANMTVEERATIRAEAEVKAEERREMMANRLDEMHTKMAERARVAIEKRQEVFANLRTRIDAMRLHGDGSLRADLRARIDANDTRFAELRNKIEGSADADELKGHVREANDIFRGMSLEVPRTQLGAAFNRAKSFADGLVTLHGKLQARIDTASSAGSDVAELSSMNATLLSATTDVSTKIDASIDALRVLDFSGTTEENFTANKETLKAMRAELATYHQTLKGLRASAGEIVRGLKALTVTADSDTEVTAETEATDSE